METIRHIRIDRKNVQNQPARPSNPRLSTSLDAFIFNP